MFNTFTCLLEAASAWAAASRSTHYESEFALCLPAGGGAGGLPTTMFKCFGSL
jgi:hypothetical protein